MTNTAGEKAAFFADARNDTPGPLEGLRVIEVGTTWAGPRCCQVFGDYGAEVIKVEIKRAPDVSRRLPPMMPDSDPPDGYLNATVNRNKRSLTLDLQSPEGSKIFLELAKTADIVVQNLKKGTLSGWGCGYDDVRGVKPDIVYVSISAFGQYGPYSDRPGYDPLAQALSGFMHMNGTEGEDVPAKAPIFLADELAGLHAVMAGMAALRHRDQSGEGQHVDISLIDAMIDSSTGIHTMAAHGLPTPRLGNTFSFAVPSGAYRCKDGWVYAGILLDSHWAILAKLMGRPELADDPEYASLAGRMPKRDEIDKLFSDWCAERSRDELVAIFEEAGLPGGAVLRPEEAVNDPHVKARETIKSVQTPEGVEQLIPGPSAKFSRTPVDVRKTARPLGADTTDVLNELGIGEEDQRNLEEKGVV